MKCPCQSGCPDGCPCPEYVCPITTTTMTTTTTVASPRTDMLILNTYSTLNVPVISNASGRDDRNFYFLMGENTQVYHSCSLTWRNEHFVFGGSSQKRQISQIVGCELKRVGSLAFDHYFGACTTVGNSLIYLCFNYESGDYKKCRMATSPMGQFEEINPSTDDHEYTRIAASDCRLRIKHSI